MNKTTHKLIEKSRKRKYNQFLRFCQPDGNSSVLDVGASNKEYRSSDNNLEKNYKYKHNITALGVGNLEDFARRYPEIRVVTYKGAKFPFEDRSFDFVWSNAVIEHVGGKDRQEIFISEMLRVTRKKLMFTTPSRRFPFELHTRLPLVHWLPKKASDWIYIHVGKRFASGDYMNLPFRKDLTALLEKVKAKHWFDYKIVDNKLLSVTATFTVLITKK